MKSLFFLITLVLYSTGIDKDNLEHRYISDDNYKYDFFVKEEPLKNHDNLKEYFWFKAGKIHNTKGGSNGKLLDGTYKKSYRTNQIAALGDFKDGLKNKQWKHWYENGQLKEIIQWKKGHKNGTYKSYNQKGELELKGRYSNNKKSGKWISFTSNDTLYYKKGAIFNKEKESQKEPSKLTILFNKIFKKEEKATTEKKEKKPSKLKDFFTKKNNKNKANKKKTK